MPKKGKKLRKGSLKGGKNKPFRGKRGTGTRFKNCMKRMRAKKGVKDPRKMCAAIMYAKYGRSIRHK